MALQRTEILLPARGRFDLAHTATSSGDPPLPPWRWRPGPRPQLERAEQLPDGSVHLLRIRPATRGVVLQVTGRAAREIEVLAPLAARVRRALRLDEDFDPFQVACARDAVLRPVGRLAPGRLLRGTSVFEDVVTVLATGSRTRDGAFRVLMRLGSLGRRCPAASGLRAFPAPARLARISPVRARRAGLEPRGSWMRGLARAASSAELGLEALDRASVAEARRVLAAVRGLGPVGVARALLTLGHHDQPVFDRAARAFARTRFQDDRFDRWLRRQRPWRGLALWYACRIDRDALRPRAATRPAGRASRG